MAAPYKDDATGLTVEVEGSGVTLSQTRFTMAKKQWTPFTVTLTGTGTIRLKFTPEKRFFLDEVLITANSTDPTSIQNVQHSMNVQTDAWFTLDGRMLQGVPTKKGVYIKNGKKMIIK
jgi:hypothetical protein